MEHHFRVHLFIAATDALLQELDHRFDENMIDLLILSASLDPKDSFKSFDIEKYAIWQTNTILKTSPIKKNFNFGMNCNIFTLMFVNICNLKSPQL